MVEAPSTMRTAPVTGAVAPQAADERLRALVVPHLDFVGRLLRNLGAPEADIEDLLQIAFSVAARRLPDIRSGSERAFLVQTAIRLAANARRERARTREIPTDVLPEVADLAPSPEELSAGRRARALLDEVLEDMPLELRSVLVLFEIEEMPTAEIASLLQIPRGTVASRLRRAREDFLGRLRRLGLVDPHTREAP